MLGSQEQQVNDARQGFMCMQHRPEIAYKCGPFALNRLLVESHKTKGKSPLLEKARSTSKGTNLAQLNN